VSRANRRNDKSLEEVPNFASEDEERARWATHDLAEELGVDGTERHQALFLVSAASCYKMAGNYTKALALSGKNNKV